MRRVNVIRNIRRNMNAPLMCLLLLATCLLSSLYLTMDWVSCAVVGSEQSNVDGYYEALNGVYVRKSLGIYDHNPDMFQLIDRKRSVNSGSVIIALTMHTWSVYDELHQKMLFSNQPDHPEDFLYQPPKSGWTSIDPATSSVKSRMSVTRCVGSLENSPSISTGGATSNVQQLLERPVTSILLAVIFGIAYYLWAYKVEVSSVSYSYDMVVMCREYWRAMTASFSHFELFHLVFNAMGLYQLGILEPVYGSVQFLYLSIDLVVITMLLCSVMYHVLINRFNRFDMVTQQAVGYSCVLFAWMVALSSRQRNFCPIFLFPNFCIDTWFIPLPQSAVRVTGIASVPINVGPLALLFFTKLIMPQSSLIGHLSGIIIGYPLAWNLLNWLTPPLLLAGLIIGYICSERLFVWRFPAFSAENIDLESFVEAHLIRDQKLILIVGYLFSASLAPALVFFMGLNQIIPRLLEGFLLCSAAYACRTQWCVSLSSVQHDCNQLVLIAAFYLFVLLTYDTCTLLSWFTAEDFIVYGSGLSYWYVQYATQVLGVVVLIEAAAVMMLMKQLLSTSSAAPLLAMFKCDSSCIAEDLRLFGIAPSSSAAVTSPFSGSFHRLSNTPAEDNSRSSNQLYI